MIGRTSAFVFAAAVSAAAVAVVAAPSAAADAGPAGFVQTNLVADQPGHAAVTDPNLVNPWGLAASPTTPLWVSDNGADRATLYAATKPVVAVPLVVTVRSGAPTGQVFNSLGSGFAVHDGSGHTGPAVFLFDSENGGIDGWNPTVGATGSAPSTTTEVAVRNGANAVYKALTLGTTRTGATYLYAANFRSGRVETYDTTFTPVELPGGLFVDPGIPAGYAPFDVQELAGRLYVTYAKQDSRLHDDVAGPGNGYVDVFANDGRFVRRLVTRGALNSPWGLALAPASFGRFAGALLVGNFGDGRINAYNADSGVFLGTLRTPQGTPIAIDGLWGLRVGNGNVATTRQLIFSAGPDHESHGLLGTITPTG